MTKLLGVINILKTLPWIFPLLLSAFLPRVVILTNLLRRPWWNTLWGNELPHVSKRIKPNQVSQLSSLTRLRQVSRFWWASMRYAGGEPYEYAWGEAEFLGKVFEVNRAALIPRPETEELTALVINHIEHIRSKKITTETLNQPLRILDLGTGSGVIAISLQVALNAMKGVGISAEITAVDISVPALRVAQKNSMRILKTASPMPRFICADGFVLLADPTFFSQFDVVVSNPPYVGTNTTEIKRMSSTTKQYEPAVALYGGEDGLEYYQKIAAALKKLRTLKTTTIKIPYKIPHIYLEIGDQQGRELKNLFSEFSYINVEIKKDMFGKDRFLVLSSIL